MSWLVLKGGALKARPTSSHPVHQVKSSLDFAAESLSQRLFLPLSGQCFACDTEDTWDCFLDSRHFHFMGRCRKSLVPTAAELRTVFWIGLPVLMTAVGLDASEIFAGRHHPSDLLVPLTHTWLVCVASMRGLCVYPMEAKYFAHIWPLLTWLCSTILRCYVQTCAAVQSVFVWGNQHPRSYLSSSPLTSPEILTWFRRERKETSDW